MRYWIILAMLMGSIGRAGAQAQQLLHVTYEVPAEISQIQTDIVGNFVGIDNWAGDHILIEIKVQLHGASDRILKHFMEDGRYSIEAKQNNEKLLLVSKEKEHKPIKTKEGECVELVHYRIFIPDSFSKTGKNDWVRPLNTDDVPQVDTIKGNNR